MEEMQRLGEKRRGDVKQFKTAREVLRLTGGIPLEVFPCLAPASARGRSSRM
jgi:hypothetical protein